MNTITISGKLGTQPFIKKTKSGKEFLNFFFIHNESDGVLFSNLAIGVNYFNGLTYELKNLLKGQEVIITGKLMSNKVDDKIYYSIKAENILLLNSNISSNNDNKDKQLKYDKENNLVSKQPKFMASSTEFEEPPW